MSIADVEYRETMAEAIVELRAFCVRRTSGLHPTLARAVWLAIPAVRWGTIGDEELDRQMQLDLIAAHEYGGYHGLAADWIEDKADYIVGLWLVRDAARCAKGQE
jgi:hypothetical protein